MSAAIVAEARTWLHTPWVHQQATKGVATDCAGLVRGVLLTLPQFAGREAEAQSFLGYARQPDGVSLQAACDRFLVRVPKADMRPGDVVLMRFDRHPQHLGIVGDYPLGGLSLIHAIQSPGHVCEHRLDAKWLRRVVQAYRVPA